MDNLINKFDAPDYFKFYLLPVLIISLLGYIISYNYFITVYNDDGFLYKKYDNECLNEINEYCLKKYDLNDDIKQCVNNNMYKCKYTYEKTGKLVPLLLYIFLPLLIAIILSSIFYKVLIYIKNPRIAAGMFLLQNLLPRNTRNTRRY